MIQYPIAFFARARSDSGIDASWTSESSERALTCSIPPEFEGPGGGVSPEDLFAQALTNCFVATFKVYAEKSKVTFSSLDVSTELTVDLDDARRPVMKRAAVRAAIAGAHPADRARKLAERAFASGFILNSVKTELTLELEVTGVETAHAQ